MNSNATSQLGLSIRRTSRWLGLLSAISLSACSWNAIDPGVQSKVSAAVYPGMSMDEAQANIEGMGYDCQTRTGSYTDDAGNEQDAKTFLSCTHRPAAVSFYCNMRPQVTIVPNGPKVAKVVITSAPSCQHTQ